MVYATKHKLIQTHIRPTDTVLDVGFWGQAVTRESPEWPHQILRECAGDVYGVDVEYDESVLGSSEKYQKANAEHFSFNKKFDVIFASEIIEHLSNPGLFLDACRVHLRQGGELILTTPNAFNLFTIAEKICKREPSVNPDHTFYFNHVVLGKLLEKNGWEVVEQSYLDTFPRCVSVFRHLLYLKHRLFTFSRRNT